MNRPFDLPTTLAAMAAVIVLGACRPSSESNAPPKNSTPSTPTSSASAAASGASPGVSAATGTELRTDGTGSAAPAGTPK